MPCITHWSSHCFVHTMLGCGLYSAGISLLGMVCLSPFSAWHTPVHPLLLMSCTTFSVKLYGTAFLLSDGLGNWLHPLCVSHCTLQVLLCYYSGLQWFVYMFVFPLACEQPESWDHIHQCIFSVCAQQLFEWITGPSWSGYSVFWTLLTLAFIIFCLVLPAWHRHCPIKAETGHRAEAS